MANQIDIVSPLIRRFLSIVVLFLFVGCNYTINEDLFVTHENSEYVLGGKLMKGSAITGTGVNSYGADIYFSVYQEMAVMYILGDSGEYEPLKVYDGTYQVITNYGVDLTFDVVNNKVSNYKISNKSIKNTESDMCIVAKHIYDYYVLNKYNDIQNLYTTHNDTVIRLFAYGDRNYALLTTLDGDVSLLNGRYYIKRNSEGTYNLVAYGSVTNYFMKIRDCVESVY